MAVGGEGWRQEKKIGAVPLGLARFAWLARRTPLPVIALGGMNPLRGRRLASFGAYGWAAIDAWQ
jgi:thiamine-phosphate pyrophosphorylase